MRPEQLEALGAARRGELPAKIVRFLHRHAPEQATRMGDRKLLAFVETCLAKAEETHHLGIEWDLCRFCWMCIEHGLDFDTETEWGREIFDDAEGTPTDRIDLLERYHLNYLTR